MLRIFSVILLLLLLFIACVGGSNGDKKVTASNLTVFQTPDGRQYSNLTRNLPKDLMLSDAQQWKVEVTGDIELLSEFPSYSGSKFRGDF